MKMQKELTPSVSGRGWFAVMLFSSLASLLTVTICIGIAYQDFNHSVWASVYAAKGYEPPALAGLFRRSIDLDGLFQLFPP